MRTALFFAVAFLALPFFTYAAEDNSFRATVTHILSEEREELPGTSAVILVQSLRAETDGGEEVFIENDRVPLKEGDAFFGTYIEGPEGRIYSVRDPDRRGVLLVAVLLFAAITIAVARMTGLRSLASLTFSILVIVFGLLPLLATGAEPLLVSAASAAVILAVAMLATHGVSVETAAAWVSSMVTVIIAILVSEALVTAARLSGFAGDESAILNLTTGGSLNMEGLLLGAIIIGVLGIIDDLTITQVSTVAALQDANPSLSARELYARAMKVGREHLGAVVNTLVLAYAGGALPLLLLFSLSPASPLSLLNSDVLAIEIIRSAVGGMALALSVPLATALGVWGARWKEKNRSRVSLQ